MGTEPLSVEPDWAGRVALHYAAVENDVSAARAELDAGADVNACDRSGFTPLHFAAQEQSSEVARLLLASGADVDPVDGYGNTPLWRAVFNSRGNGELVRMLREAGADPWHANDSGSTPVALARLIANSDVAQFFADLPDEQPD